ncbi:MAG: TonB-dependent receptor [Ignavibacteria bacterium]|nr:MAG: TonB-dependent receptor [Ignavibacteria bacterium]KAF0160965.1 MAG: TonB-dependent receptor [Ignavibacteria bacterium]
MNYKLSLFLLLVFSTLIYSQQMLNGRVVEKNEAGKIVPLTGVNILWKGTQVGTNTDLDGKFSVPYKNEYQELTASMVGYKTISLHIENVSETVEIVMQVEAAQLGEVGVVGKQTATFSDYLSIENKGVMTDKELFKAACCNLSESFETNPSIDVSFTDAITGAKQIEMLGLSGVYTQTTMENLPYIRGLMSNVGLTFIPGTWIQAINVSKGIGSVANGFESMTGQIDVDLKKPYTVEGEKLFVNMYADYDRRFEGNLNYRTSLSEKLSVINLFHASSRKYGFDNNNDMFSDVPNFETYNVMQRWQLHTESGWEGQFGFQYLSDSKEGGTLQESHIHVESADYKYSTNNNQLNIYGKFGYVFPEAAYQSFGIQWSLNSYRNTSLFGTRNYNGNEKTGYFNFIYQSNFGSPNHKFRTGFSFLFDQFDETFISNQYKRVERIPGLFFEYTYTVDDDLSFILGSRADQHNYYGFMFTPRFHMRWAPQQDWVFRAAAGRGYRTSNIFSENSSVFASSRKLNILSNESFGYGLAQEIAWNFGLNLTHYFSYNYRQGTVSVDLYRTQFEQSTIADLDFNPQTVNFYSVQNGSYSNSFQIEVNYHFMAGLDTRAAYRFMDVKQEIGGKMLDRPFTSRHRALLNFAYSTEREAKDEPQMNYDLTVQWFGSKRLPSTSANPANIQAREKSPSFAVVNLQVTRSFFLGFDLYLGVENLLGFKQNNPILDPQNPHGNFFDASMIWGPINGRMVYTGLRYKM